MEKFLRNKTEIFLWLTALILAGLLTTFAIYSVNYITEQFAAINDPNLLKAIEVVKFNLEKVQELRK